MLVYNNNHQIFQTGYFANGCGHRNGTCMIPQRYGRGSAFC